jgi:hypothetical protein
MGDTPPDDMPVGCGDCIPHLPSHISVLAYWPVWGGASGILNKITPTIYFGDLYGAGWSEHCQVEFCYGATQDGCVVFGGCNIMVQCGVGCSPFRVGGDDGCWADVG